MNPNDEFYRKLAERILKYQFPAWTNSIEDNLTIFLKEMNSWLAPIAFAKSVIQRRERADSSPFIEATHKLGADAVAWVLRCPNQFKEGEADALGRIRVGYVPRDLNEQFFRENFRSLYNGSSNSTQFATFCQMFINKRPFIKRSPLTRYVLWART